MSFFLTLYPSFLITAVAVGFMLACGESRKMRAIGRKLLPLGLTAWLWFPWFWYSIENVARWNFDNVMEVMK